MHKQDEREVVLPAMSTEKASCCLAPKSSWALRMASRAEDSSRMKKPAGAMVTTVTLCPRSMRARQTCGSMWAPMHEGVQPEDWTPLSMALLRLEMMSRVPSAAKGASASSDGFYQACVRQLNSSSKWLPTSTARVACPRPWPVM